MGISNKFPLHTSRFARVFVAIQHRYINVAIHWYLVSGLDDHCRFVCMVCTQCMAVKYYFVHSNTCDIPGNKVVIAVQSDDQ